MNLKLGIIAACAALTGCAMSTEAIVDEITDEIIDSGAQTFQSLSAGNDDLRVESARIFTEEGAPSEIPTTGSAGYLGIAEFGTSALPSVLGVATLTTNFKDGEVTGGVTGLIGEDGTVYAGALVLGESEIDAETGAVVADVSGVLVDASETIDVTGSLDAGFMGDDLDYIRGDLTTIWDSGSGSTEMSGELTAERQ